MNTSSGVLIAILAALAAGAFLATTGVLQQRAASQRPQREQLSWRLIASLARYRIWLVGLGTAALAHLSKGVALAFGTLVLVQPLIVSELIFAVPVSVRQRGLRLHARERGAILAVVAGLAIGIYAAYPHGGDPLPGLTAWGTAVGAVVVVAGTAVAVGRKIQPPVQASLYALAGAVVLALQSALFAATAALFKQGVVEAFTAWQPYALIPASVGGMLLVESAYQAGPLPASMPVMDAVLPAAGIALGIALFGEEIRTGALPLLGAAVGLVLLIAGTILLDTSPLVRRLELVEETEQVDTPDSSPTHESGG